MSSALNSRERKQLREGGPAFPVETDLTLPNVSPGISVRDYFAGQALLGMLAAGSLAAVDKRARFAYEMADAMMVERSKP